MMDSSIFDTKFRSRLQALSTTNLSDAMDSVGIAGAVIGVRPMFHSPRVVGRAVTIKIPAAGMKKSETHLGVEAIAASQPGDVIVISNHGDVKNNCWGEVLSCAAKVKGVGGVVVGRAPARSHYARVGFDLLLRRRDDGDVALEARERVVLGWWEREAVGEVLQGRLEEIREDLISPS